DRSTCQRLISWLQVVCVTTVFTRPRFARRHALHCLRAVTTMYTTPEPLWKRLLLSRAIRVFVPIAWRHWPKYSARMVIAQQPLGNITKRRLGRFQFQVPMIAGLPIRASTNSMVLLVAKPINGHLPFTMRRKGGTAS